MTEPAGQAYPTVQLPLQFDVVSPIALPKLPAEHGLHVAVPVDAAKVPRGQGVHSPPVALYCPIVQSEQGVLPPGDDCPALQG